MKIRIDKIQRAAHNQKPGLVDAWIISKNFDCPMTLAFQEQAFEEDSEIDNCYIFLYYYQNENEDFLVYENEEAYHLECDSSMAPESIIPVGNFSDNRSAYSRINATVTDVKEEDGYVYLDLSCNGITFYATVEAVSDRKIEIGNIVRALWWAELVIEENS